MKQTQLEMELHRLEREGALKLQQEKVAVDARHSSSEDGSALSRTIAFQWENPRSKNVFVWIIKLTVSIKNVLLNSDPMRRTFQNYQLTRPV